MKFKYAALALAAALIMGGEAKAQWGLGYGGGGFAGYGYGAYALGHIPTPPYFALHPPVYYGQVIHRTYGRSPFATGSAAPFSSRYRARRLAPRLVINKHVDASLQAQFKKASARPRPQLVLNPYVEQSEGSAQLATQASDAKPQPQMIINPYFTPATHIAGN